MSLDLAEDHFTGLNEVLHGNVLAIDLDALPEGRDVRRSEEASFEAHGLQGCGCFERDRAFAVGTGYVDDFELVLMRIAEYACKA